MSTKTNQNSNKNSAAGLLALVPKNKFDDRNLDKINVLSDSEMQVIMKDLMEKAIQEDFTGMRFLRQQDL